MMKRHWLFILLVVAMFGTAMYMRSQSAVTPAQEAAVAHLNWHTDFAAAQATARGENKALLINFTGSDWCPPCMRLRKEVFSQSEFAAYARQNLVLLDVDFPRRKALTSTQQSSNDALARKFGIQGFPTIVVLDATGSTLGKFGYTPGGPKAFIRRIETLRAARSAS